MKISFFSITLILFIMIFGCQRHPSIRECVDYWQVTRQIKVIPNSSILIDTTNRTHCIKPGHNCVLEFSFICDPVFKKGKELTDLSSTNSLILELDNRDSIFETKGTYFSHAYRFLYAFSPYIGISKLNPMDIIDCRKISDTKWLIDFEIRLHQDRDLIKYKGVISIRDTISISNIYKDYY
jgi:hypothetical protein